MRTEMMTFTPANRKFFTQLIGQKANKNENKTNFILVVVWANQGSEKGIGGGFGQGRPLKVNPVQEARRNADNI